MSGKYGGLYSGNWVKAEDLHQEYTPVVLTQIRPEAIRQDSGADRTMLCVGFHGAEKRLILNVTNYNTLVEILGPNEDAWEGHQVNLHKTTTQMAGKTVACIRIVPAQQQAPPPQPVAPPSPLPAPVAPAQPAGIAPPVAPPAFAGAPAVPAESGFGAAPSPPVEAYGQAPPDDDDIPF
jgi:hypothetical protein